MNRKRYIPLLIAGVLLLASMACGDQDLTPTSSHGDNTEGSYEEGDSTQSLSYDGLERTYVLHIPPGFDPSQSTPLVLAFHGLTLDAEEMIRISGFNEKSDEEGFIVVYPNASGEQRSWNGGHCCGEAALNNIDDVGFTAALIEKLSSSMAIDPTRIYATGFSNGAIMAYRLACELSDQIAAFGMVSATPAREDLEACQPDRPIPIIHFHGTDDDANPYYGGESPGGVQFTSAAETVQFWAAFDGCPTEPQSETTGSIVHDVYSPCQDESSVELYTITNGEHAWPGGEAVSLRMGEPTMEISATDLLWDFFKAHSLP